MNRLFPGRLQAVALACVASLSCSLPAMAGSVRFQVQELYTPQGAVSFANDINARGQVAGYVQSGDASTRRAAVWDGTTALKLQLGDGTASEAHAINDLGQSVGWVNYGSSQSRAALWNGTQLTLLATSNWLDRAHDINNAGLVVGNLGGHAAAWDAQGVHNLGLLVNGGQVASTAASVNSWGMIGGSAPVPATGFEPLAWYNNGNGYTQSGSFGVIAVNDLGQALGLNDARAMAPVMVWNGSVTPMLPDGVGGYFYKLNNAGQAVGSAQMPGGPAAGSAMLWSSSGGAVVINSVLQPGSVQLQWAGSLNDAGQLAATTANGRAAVLTPTGTLRWTGPSSGGAFNDAANWDSGLGFAPNRFLDVQLASAGRLDVTGIADDQDVKSLLVGGSGGVNTLWLVEGGRINALEGSWLMPGGRLGTTANSDAVFATGHLGGDLTMYAGSGIVLKADTAASRQLDRLIVDGAVTLTGGDLVITLDGRFALRAGDSWDFLDFGSTSGQFSQLRLPTLASGLVWDSSRLYSDGVLSIAAAVPEPGSYGLMALGLLAIGWQRRGLFKRSSR
ncbi:MAG: PEP-CTERM sorting domain-containing protein [Rubrivivax sp.]